jgi:glucose/arabinose dehydrogenase
MIFLPLVVLLSFLAPQPSHGIPSGFVDEGVASMVAITGAFAPNPRNGNKPMLLASNKFGKIMAIEDPDNSGAFIEVVDLESRMCHNGERGLQSIRPHPDFAINQYLYVFYAQENNGCFEDPETGPRNRLSRFTMDKDTLKLDLESELILLETPPLPKRVHNGGNIAFGNDGKLYVTTGDGGSRSPAVSQDPGHLHGKILRLNEDGSIPTDNPFAAEGVACGLIGGKTTSDGDVCGEVYVYHAVHVCASCHGTGCACCMPVVR